MQLLPMSEEGLRILIQFDVLIQTLIHMITLIVTVSSFIFSFKLACDQVCPEIIIDCNCVQVHKMRLYFSFL